MPRRYISRLCIVLLFLTALYIWVQPAIYLPSLRYRVQHSQFARIAGVDLHDHPELLTLLHQTQQFDVAPPEEQAYAFATLGNYNTPRRWYESILEWRDRNDTAVAQHRAILIGGEEGCPLTYHRRTGYLGDAKRGEWCILPETLRQELDRQLARREAQEAEEQAARTQELQRQMQQFQGPTKDPPTFIP